MRQSDSSILSSNIAGCCILKICKYANFYLRAKVSRCSWINVYNVASGNKLEVLLYNIISNCRNGIQSASLDIYYIVSDIGRQLVAEAFHYFTCYLTIAPSSYTFISVFVGWLQLAMDYCIFYPWMTFKSNA